MKPVIAVEEISVYATGLDHPECLAFDRGGWLYAGGEAGQVYRVKPGGGEAEEICRLGGFSGGVAFTPDDEELVVCNPLLGLVMVKRDGSHRVLATHAGEHKMICPNYAVFGKDGSLYVTDSGNWKKGNGRVMRFKGGRGEVVSGLLGYANGLAISTENILFMVESDTNSIKNFQILGDGSLGEVAHFAGEVGRLPDGLAMDEGGNLYASCYASDDVHRFSGDGGKREWLAHDPFGIVLSRPTNMAFGGEAGDEMFFANLGRTTITKVRVGVRGMRLANMR
ncbi:MAG TPA: SMP-30/gluconolactonase/LRE family protein [Tepidisphaeraceae bacterium]|jgi:gluconolactonase|nr:SMP-30/gluconolactonase/LRE family protein [Tepidisphaeraceae bacterium]